MILTLSPLFLLTTHSSRVMGDNFLYHVDLSLVPKNTIPGIPVTPFKRTSSLHRLSPPSSHLPKNHTPQILTQLPLLDSISRPSFQDLSSIATITSRIRPLRTSLPTSVLHLNQDHPSLHTRYSKDFTTIFCPFCVRSSATLSPVSLVPRTPPSIQCASALLIPSAPNIIRFVYQEPIPSRNFYLYY